MRNMTSSLMLALLLSAPLPGVSAQSGNSADFNRAVENIKKGTSSALRSVKKGTQNAWEGSEETRNKVGEKSKGVWQSVKDLFD